MNLFIVFKHFCPKLTDFQGVFTTYGNAVAACVDIEYYIIVGKSDLYLPKDHNNCCVCICPARNIYRPIGKSEWEPIPEDFNP